MISNCSFIDRIFILLVTFMILLLWINNNALAHCDTMTGPVIKAAEKSLQTGDISYILIWVGSKDEAEVKSTFQKVLAVRKLNTQAAAFADRYFFETVVRLHRAGEGVPYTGLKNAEPNQEPAIDAADEAIKSGNINPVIKIETDAIQNGIQEHFGQVMNKKKFNPSDIKAGREYVESYVSYIHYVNGIYLAATKPVHGHYPDHNE